MKDHINWKEIAKMSWPLILAQISEILFNLVDTLMVGMLGTTELASVGLSSTAVCFVQASIMGVGSAVQSQASRRIGEGNDMQSGKVMNSGIYVAIAFGLPTMLLALWGSGAIIGLLTSDPKIIPLGLEFFQIRMLGIIAYAISIAFRGFWSSVKLDKLYLTTTVTAHILNILLNYLLIYGNLGFPKLGVAGSALATDIALFVAATLNVVLALSYKNKYGFNLQLPSRKEFKDLLVLAIPSGLQQMFFWLGFVVLLWIVGKIGEGELAIVHVLLQFNFVSILTGLAIGVTSGAIVGRELGNKNLDDAYEWALTAAKYALVIIGGIGLVLALFTQTIIQLYFEPLLQELAFWPFLISGLIMWAEAIVFVFMYSQFGAGDMKRPVIVTVVMQWLFFLPLCYVAGYYLKLGIIAIWGLFATYRIIVAAIMYIQWKQKKWQLIQI